MLLHSSIGILNSSVKNKLKNTKIPYSNNGYDLIKLLFKLGFVSSYYIEYNSIYITLRFYNNDISLNNIFFFFKPSSIFSISSSKLRRICKNKKKLFILLTSYGICTSSDAIKLNQGGILLVELS